MQEKVDFIILKDYEVQLKQKSELLLVINFENTTDVTFKAAILPKALFPKYLINNSKEEAKGYFDYNGLTIIVYGNPTGHLKPKALKKSMTYLIPAKRKKPRIGQPPLPPVNIEPQVFSFLYSDDCYSLVRSSVADTLFD